ncbi:hypothetical protein O181_095354 [Austropuccinia psidii MF-1]|uniref:Uncharacterized protein n=1 Tax=Austropuccinia psidii MF-1 TaxID=1389203 RepID=A0A9Q3J558_9BASI|nr:hypothetical protein [Austropuccinia psidii MF-1]
MDTNTPTNTFEASAAPLGPEIQQMLVKIRNFQEKITSSISTLKDDVDKLKLCLDVPKENQNKTSKCIEKSPPSAKKSILKKAYGRAQLEPPPPMSAIKRKNKHEEVKPQTLLKHTLVKANTPRWHPLQMLEIHYKPELKGVKEAIYAHIKSLWNIMEKNSLPTPPSEADLVKLYRKLYNTSQIEDALQEQEGLSIDGKEDLHEFSKKQLHQVNLG